jgi:hypothetical protein
MSLQHLKQQALANADVRVEYERLENEFAFIDQLLSMRAQAGVNPRTARKAHAHSKKQHQPIGTRQRQPQLGDIIKIRPCLWF